MCSGLALMWLMPVGGFLFEYHISNYNDRKVPRLGAFVFKLAHHFCVGGRWGGWVLFHMPTSIQMQWYNTRELREDHPFSLNETTSFANISCHTGSHCLECQASDKTQTQIGYILLCKFILFECVHLHIIGIATQITIVKLFMIRKWILYPIYINNIFAWTASKSKPYDWRDISGSECCPQYKRNMYLYCECVCV